MARRPRSEGRTRRRRGVALSEGVARRGLPPAGFEPVAGWIAAGDNAVRGVVRSLTLPLFDRTSPRREEWRLLAAMVDGSSAELTLGALVLQSAKKAIMLEPTNLDDVATELDDFVLAHLRDLNCAWRRDVIDFVLDATKAERDRHELGVRLNHVRELLRDPLTPSVIDADQPRAVHIDSIWRLDESSFYVKGWTHCEFGPAERLTALSPEGERVELAQTAFRYPRPDVADFYGRTEKDRGFAAFFETQHPSLSSAGWIMELRDGVGREVQFDLPPVSADRKEARANILQDLRLELLPKDELRRNHIRPALTRLQERVTAEVEIDTVEEYGEGVERPEVSIVVPLYRRTEFLEHQLAQFVHDDELRAIADLVYVLDSPDDAMYLRTFAPQLYRLYGVPFRLVILNQNGGFSAVNNFGASVARGERLLLMNSDVLPAAPGWLGKLLDFHRANPQIGTVSPKLLYEDDSIQHAGLYFYRPPAAYVWSNEHYLKGMHRSVKAAAVSRPVPAVTGACLLISTELYRELGGLRGEYVQGDYEDSDLCLRLAEAGYESWYFADVELYHLEGQSYPSEERELISEYNKWLHTDLWRDALIAQGEL